MRKVLVIVDPFDPIASLDVMGMFVDDVVDGVCVVDNVSYECFNKCYCLNVGNLGVFDFRGIAKVISGVILDASYDVVVVSATRYLKTLLPRVSVLCEAGLTADVVEIDVDLKMTRPTYQDKMLATIVSKTKPVMLSVRPGVYKWPKKSYIGGCEVVGCDVLDYEYEMSEKSVGVDLRSAELIISGGLGMGRNISELFKFKDFLNMEVGASKNLVDMGLIDYKHQVGMSGKIVKPKVYVALGIEGAYHHISGMRDSDFIVSVNLDRFAALSMVSDVVIIGDCNLFVSKLLAKFDSK